MRKLVIRVVVDVLRHVAVELLKTGDIKGSESGWERKVNGRISHRARSLRPGSPQFGVLPPQIGLDRFQRLQEAQDRSVSPVQLAVVALMPLRESACWRVQKSHSHCCCACCSNTCFQK